MEPRKVRIYIKGGIVTIMFLVALDIFIGSAIENTSASLAFHAFIICIVLLVWAVATSIAFIFPISEKMQELTERISHVEDMIRQCSEKD